MMKIELVDGTILNLNDGSSITCFKLTCGAFVEVDELNMKLTEENMKTVIVDETTIYNEIIPIGLTAVKSGDQVEVTAVNREKTFEEKVQEILVEQSDAIMELAELSVADTITSEDTEVA